MFNPNKKGLKRPKTSRATVPLRLGGGGSKLPDHLEGAGCLRRLRVRAGLLCPQQRPREDARQRLSSLTPYEKIFLKFSF
jgi:hypothetical protein